MTKVQFSGSMAQILSEMREFLKMHDQPVISIDPALASPALIEQAEDLKDRLELEPAAKIREQRLPVLKQIHAKIRAERPKVDPMFDSNRPAVDIPVDTVHKNAAECSRCHMPLSMSEGNDQCRGCGGAIALPVGLSKPQPKGSSRECPHCKLSFLRLGKHEPHCAKRPKGGATVRLAQQLADHHDQ